MSRHLDDLDAVLESDALDDFRQLVFALQAPPCSCCRHDELEHHQLGGFCRQRSLRAHGAMTHGRDHALDRVRSAQMVPMLGRKVEEGEQRILILGQAGDRLVVLGGPGLAGRTAKR